MTDNTLPGVTLDPEVRRKVEARHDGVPLILGDGQTWTLPFCRRSKVLADWRDEFAVKAYTGGRFDATTVQAAALILITTAYDLTLEEAAALICTAKPQELLDAVLDAVLLPADNDHATLRTYNDWLTGGLLANGLGQAKITDAQLPWVVKHLVDTGRMAPIEKFMTAAIAAGVRANLLASLAAD